MAPTIRPPMPVFDALESMALFFTSKLHALELEEDDDGILRSESYRKQCFIVFLACVAVSVVFPFIGAPKLVSVLTSALAILFLLRSLMVHEVVVDGARGVFEETKGFAWNAKRFECDLADQAVSLRSETATVESGSGRGTARTNVIALYVGSERYVLASYFPDDKTEALIEHFRQIVKCRG